MKILGIDPGLQKIGWGIIKIDGHALSFVACGLIKTNPAQTVPERLCEIDSGLSNVIQGYNPDEAAIEETFMNKNPASALKLGVARGVAIVVPARLGIPVGEYAANLVKKSIVGSGHASKEQMGMMIRTLLPSAPKTMGADEADALAIAICHAHHAQSRNKLKEA